MSKSSPNVCTECRLCRLWAVLCVALVVLLVLQAARGAEVRMELPVVEYIGETDVPADEWYVERDEQNRVSGGHTRVQVRLRLRCGPTQPDRMYRLERAYELVPTLMPWETNAAHIRVWKGMSPYVPGNGGTLEFCGGYPWWVESHRGQKVFFRIRIQ